jgi:hypothetical protein
MSYGSLFLWFLFYFLCFTLGFHGGCINCDRSSTSTATAAAVMGGHSSMVTAALTQQW